MNILHKIVCLISIALPLLTAQAEDYYFHHIGMADGLPQMSVPDVYQDAEGYMWFATRQGLARYNGHAMQVFNPDAGNPDALLSSVVEEIDGDTLMNVYVRTVGINRYAARTNTMHALYTDAVEAIAATPDGLYFATKRQLCYYNAQADTVRTVCGFPEDMGTVCLLSYIDGVVYVGTVEGRVYTWSVGHALTLLYQLGGQISCVYETDARVIYIGTWTDGLYAMHPGGQVHYTAGNGLVSDFVRTIQEDERNVLWVGTDVGLQRLSDKRLFLNGQSIWHLHLDRGGNLWAGTYFDGVFFFNPSIDYYTTMPLPFKQFPVISHILPLPRQRMVLSTEGDGLYAIGPAGQVLAHVDIPNIKATYYDAAHGMLYLGTHLHGLYAVSLQPLLTARDGQTVRMEAKHYELPFAHRNGCQIIRSIVAAGDSLLLGTHNGLYVWYPKTREFGLLSEEIDREMPKAVSLALAPDGKHLYIGGSKLLRYGMEDGKTEVLPVSTGEIEKLLVDQYGRLWVGTDGNGVWECRVADTLASVVPYSSRTCGLQNDYIRNLLQTPRGHILVMTTRGFSIIQSCDSGEGVQYPVVNYSPGTYLPLSSLYNGGVALAPNGDILLAGMDGMITFREEYLHQLPILPSIVLEPPYQYEDEITLPYGKRDISLHYSIHTNNLFPENLFLRYNIVCRYNEATQHLTDWVGDIRLLNLPYGMNELALQVTDRTGNILTERELKIRVLPPVYLSWPAILCYVLLVLGAIVGGGIYLRRRFLKALERQEKRQWVEMRETIDAYIDKHLSDAELNVAQLCKQLGIGRTRLFQVFRDVYDASPQQVIAERRLQLAAEWLKNKPECNISEIAYDLGFQSPKYFSHCFKERWGMTPSAYRKQNT